MPERTKAQPKQAAVVKEKLPTTEEVLKQLVIQIRFAEYLEDVKREFGPKSKSLKPAFKAISVFIKESEALARLCTEYYQKSTKQFEYPVAVLRAFKRLRISKKRLIRQHYPALKRERIIAREARLIEEAREKLEYKTTSIENIKFRAWRKSDVATYSKYVATNIRNKQDLEKQLKANPYLWNPKGNPDLYMQQQCAEASIVLLIHYCYKNHIDLALPASSSHIALSQHKTIEGFMGALYPKFSASHLYGNGAGIFTEVSKKQAKAGDIMSIKHKNGGYHAQLVTDAFKNGKMTVLSGTQWNKDFRNDPIRRRRVERVYPIGYVKTQLNVSPSKIRMHYGGYADKPKVSNSKERYFIEQGSQIKYYRLDPAKLNRVLSKLNRKKR